MACPYCKSESPGQAVGFTWWGGVLGPKMLSHVKCPACGKGYNGKSGEPNTTGIVIYTCVVAAIAFGVAFALFSK